MDEARFSRAIGAFDGANSEDPNRETVDGVKRPYEVVYAERLTDWVRMLAPDASEELLLAARCQHIRRWTIPRSDFPEGRTGYLRWRQTLYKFHADVSGAILREVGYPEKTIARVREFNTKKDLATDPEVQILEDALCLVFLETQFADLAGKTDEEKMIDIVRKTWKRMGEKGRAAAKKLPLGPAETRLLEKALSES